MASKRDPAPGMARWRLAVGVGVAAVAQLAWSRLVLPVVVRMVPERAAHVVVGNLVSVRVRLTGVDLGEYVVSWRLAVDVQPVRVQVSHLHSAWGMG